MTLGFLGTGAITTAIVTGLRSGEGDPYPIRLSPRNAEAAAELAHRFPWVSVCGSNQEVLDGCDTVVIAVRPQVAEEVLSGLRFSCNHHVISLVAGFAQKRLAELVKPAGSVTRAVPLPSAAQRRSPTAVYPHCKRTADLFGLVGEVFEVDSEAELNALGTATATMAAYFAFAEHITWWVTQHGIPPSAARDYMARVYAGLADAAMAAPRRDFDGLAAAHATPGGLNEQLLKDLREHGVFQIFSDALDAVYRRVTAQSE
jgi:pyrroline-5-carboxylate reductase